MATEAQRATEATFQECIWTHSSPPFNDPISGQGIRARIKDLVNTIVAMNKEGSLDKTSAVKYANQGKMMFELISVDITMIGARNAEQQNNNIKVGRSPLQQLLKEA